MMRNAIRWLLPVMLAWAAAAQAAAPVAGRDYVEMNPTQPTSDPGRVVVTEYFSYQCPHCAALASTFAAWKQALPADLLVERVAVSVGHAPWEPAARAYYALVGMNLLEKLDDKVFAAIHQQGVRMDTPEQITTWIGKQGIDTKAFAAMYRSFGVDAQFKAGEARSRNSRVPAIPTIVIDGRYLVSISDIGEGRGAAREAHFRAQLAVVNELIAMARQKKKK